MNTGNPESNPLTFLPLVLSSIAFAMVAGFLARDKGRRVAVWVVVCLIPIVNVFCLAFLIGASNLRLERKLDQLLARQTHPAATMAPGVPSPDAVSRQTHPDIDT